MVEEGSTVHHHDLTSVPLPEQLSPNAELLDDLAELYKILGTAPESKFSTPSLQKSGA